MATLCLLLLLPGCTHVASFYTRPRPASYYVNSYCFEVSRDKVVPVVHGILKRYLFPVQSANLKTGSFITLPVLIRRYGRNPNFGHDIGLKITLSEHRGPIPLGNLQRSLFSGKQQPLRYGQTIRISRLI